MPLVRRDPPPAAAGTAVEELVAALADADPARRREAARALGAAGGDPAPLARALATERDPAVREALFTGLIRLGAAAPLLPFLRVEDAALRSAAVEALQDLPDQVRPHMPALLDDADPDVRLLAAEVARGLPAEEATRLLCARLEVEPHRNVCAACVEVLAEAGTPAALPTLHALAARFADDPFLPFACAAAIARIGGQD